MSSYDDNLITNSHAFTESGSIPRVIGGCDSFVNRRKAGNTDNNLASILPLSASETAVSPQPWRRGLWCLSQSYPVSSNLVVTKTRRNGHRVGLVGETNQVNPGNLLYLNPQSPSRTLGMGRTPWPRLPSDMTRQNIVLSGSRSRQTTLSPSPMYAQLQHQDQNANLEPWQREFQDFHIQLLDDGVLHSTPSSTDPLAHSISQTDSKQGNLAHLVTPQFVENSCVTGNSLYLPADQMPRGSQMAAPSIEPALQGAISRVTCPPFAGQHERLHQPAKYEYRLPPSECCNPALSWSIDPGHTSASPSKGHQNPVLEAPKPIRPLPQSLYQISEAQRDGLGIFFSDPGQPRSLENSHARPSHSLPGVISQSEKGPITQALLPPSRGFPNCPLLEMSRRCQLSTPSRSPSSSVSPTNPARSLRQKSPIRNTNAHHRSKSIGKVGPAKDSESRSIRSKTPRTPKTPNSTRVAGSFDFVNFTPKDGEKLLNDVAPSGSSKTKARREQEAREKRKRLSEAAVRAVQQLGGDIEVLQQVILSP